MKRTLLAIIFVCSALALSAQDGDIRVNYQGASPSISDFVSAFVASRDYDEEEDCADESFNAVCQAWNNRLKGIPQGEGVTLTIDEKNGYVVYEYRSEYESMKDLVKIEMCYWNEADRKHKLFAYNVACYRNGEYNPGQFDGIMFYRYNNATKKMRWVPEVDVIQRPDEGVMSSYALPRTGKDITVTYWHPGAKKVKTLKWDGRRFK
ncbi:MAG: hypothetical protein IK023_04430 [Bacteroidaceae bacterium]|nr:hypothetical protein [Bacteroidaceae bacterium]